MADITVRATSPDGASSHDLTPLLDGQPRFATAAIGGFADATLTLRGDQRRKVPYLSLIRITLGPTVLYEGQVEDADPAGGPDSLTTTVTCFGLRNLLVENSVRRIWSKRDIDWQPVTTAKGTNIGGTITLAAAGQWSTQIGAFDPSDLTKTGVKITGTGIGSAAIGSSGQAQYLLPSGVTAVRLMATVGQAPNFSGVDWILQSTTDGTTWTTPFDVAIVSSPTPAEQNKNIAWAGNAIGIRIGHFASSSFSSNDSQWTYFRDIRVLGTSLTEDATGGFYGGTILRDLIALIPGLTAGVIEDGSDFTIQAIERAIRDQALSVVEEVAGYYTREWAVWDSPLPGTARFDWKTRQLDQADWIVTTADVEQLSIKGSLDGIARTVYVLYTDAASGLDAEASSAATAQRNPYLKNGRSKDLLVRPGFPMTANTSSQLASRIAGDVGQWVPVEGTITLPATKLIQRALGPASPAMMLRGGDNILIADLPKTEIFQQGRDGETLFHIVGTDCDLKAGTVTLELEGQASRADVILARLAAVTRTLTG